MKKIANILCIQKLSLIWIIAFLCCCPFFSTANDTLTIGYNILPPFVNEEGAKITGPSVWLWEYIASENKIPFVYKKMPLDSLLTALENGKVDICMSPLTITSQRSRYMDFSSPYFISHSSLLQCKSSVFDSTIEFITSFLSIHFMRALGALALLILVFGILIWIFERKRNREEFGTGLKGIWEGFWWSAVTMTTVGYGDKSPKTIGGRIIALVWMFTAIIVISGFTASIASSLTMNRIGITKNSIEDFKNRKLGTINQSATSEWLKYNFFTNKNDYKDFGTMITALDNGEIDAIAYDRPILNKIISDDKTSSYQLIDIKYNPQYYAFGMSKYLSKELQSKINISMLEFTEDLNWRVLLSENDLN